MGPAFQRPSTLDILSAAKDLPERSGGVVTATSAAGHRRARIGERSFAALRMSMKMLPPTDRNGLRRQWNCRIRDGDRFPLAGCEVDVVVAETGRFVRHEEVDEEIVRGGLAVQVNA